ncbi:MAG: hypothetical protein V1863_00405 [Candidatus Omnitrophota bacterium]
MSSSCGYSDNIKYEKYSSKDPQIDLTMDYISGWLYSESRGSYESYAQVIFFEQDKKNKAYKAGIVVTVVDGSELKINPPTLEAVADDLLSRRQEFKDEKLVSKTKSKVLGEEGIGLLLSYKVFDVRHPLERRELSLKEKVVIFKKNARFYTVRYTNTDEEFNKFQRAFDHIVQSLRLKSSG